MLEPSFRWLSTVQRTQRAVDESVWRHGSYCSSSGSLSICRTIGGKTSHQNSAYISTMIRTLVSAAIFAGALFGQANVIDLPRGPLGDGPFTFDTAEQHKIKVTVMTKALDRPFGMAFLPGGNILVSERGGKLRIVRDGVIDPQPIAG